MLEDLRVSTDGGSKAIDLEIKDDNISRRESVARDRMPKLVLEQLENELGISFSASTSLVEKFSETYQREVELYQDWQPLLVDKDDYETGKSLQATFVEGAYRLERKAMSSTAIVTPEKRRFLPLRDRPHLKAPYLRINLVPQTSWGVNARILLPDHEWKAIKREQVYKKTGSRCLVCGGRGPKWPVEADEVWHFDDKTGVQTLRTAVPLCPPCHEVRSIGHASTRGRKAVAKEHLAWVHRWSKAEVNAFVDEAFAVWKRRNRVQWRFDFNPFEREFSCRLDLDDALAHRRNHQIVDEARRQRGGRHAKEGTIAYQPGIVRTQQQN